MTSTERDLPEDKLREIIAGCADVTPGPWVVQDGCSWRRIGTVGGRHNDGTVLAPNVASDGHPDMHAGPGQDTYANLNHIARLDPATVSAMASELLRSRAALASIRAERDAAVEALKPFADAFVRRRDFYASRHADPTIGYANFDKMPDSWPMEKMDFNMGEFRAARAIAGEQTNDA